MIKTGGVTFRNNYNKEKNNVKIIKIILIGRLTAAILTIVQLKEWRGI